MKGSRSLAVKKKQSCIGCQYLFTEDTGYSNMTVENTNIDCVINANKNLPAEKPWNLNDHDAETDVWPATMNSRCQQYIKGERVEFDVEGEVKLKDTPDLFRAMWLLVRGPRDEET